MAGRGPAPKAPGERRRYNQPARGEWVDLEPLQRSILARYQPKRFTVPPWVWNGWRADPVTSQYAPADIAAIELLAVDWASMTFADQDRRMTMLGLNPKGKRDLRWRTPNEVKTIKKAEQQKVAKLHVVEPVKQEETA